MGSALNRGFRPRREYMARGSRPMRRRRALGTAKPREGSKRELMAKLENLNARYVKLRDGMECVQCKADGQPTRDILDAGHVYPKGKFPAGKFLVENIHAQCRTHNMIHIEQPVFYLDWFIAANSFDALDALHRRCVSDWRPDRTWLLEQIEERETQIAEFEAHYSAMV